MPEESKEHKQGEIIEAPVAEVVSTDPIDENGILPMDRITSLTNEIISDLAMVKKESIEGFHFFKDLIQNDGEGSTSTKEQMTAMLNLYLSSIDSGLKVVDLLVKARKQGPQPKGSFKQENNTVNINTGGLSRREVLEEVNKLLDTKPAQSKKVDPFEDIQAEIEEEDGREP